MNIFPKYLFNSGILILVLLFSCTNSTENVEKRNTEARDDSVKMQEALTEKAKFQNRIKADRETAPMPDSAHFDSADDPAIWYNYTNPSKSLIIGTNKKRGLYVYDLEGNELQSLEIGLPNNVDLRDNVPAKNGTFKVIVACSNRTKNTVDILELDTINCRLKDSILCSIPSKVDEVYGFCLFFHKKTGKLSAFVNGKSGKIEQWSLNFASIDTVGYELVNELSVPSQPEGMVADDESSLLYVGEEEKGIHIFKIEPEAGKTSSLISESTDANPYIYFDIEGLAVIKSKEGRKFLLASIQGNFSYALFDLDNQNKYITSFVIDDNIIDGVEETDGIEVCSEGFPDFPDGILVVQDGFNKTNNSQVAQNFKIISLSKVYQVIGGKKH